MKDMKNKKKKNKVIVRCDQCKEFFKIKIKAQNLNDGDYERYFECPLCRKKYSIGYFSNRIDAMISLRYPIELVKEEQMALKQKYEVQ